MSEVLKVKNISKSYKRNIVLDKVDLSLNRGEIVGLVGPNGAGKTTLMKIITSLIRKYSGEVYFEGENIKNIKNLKTKPIGSVIETPGFYPNLTGYENLLFFAEISGLKDKREIDEIIERLDIKSYVNKKVKKYSLGMKQRLGVAQAVLSYPKILILDEPTNGLDPAIVPKLRKFIKYIAKEKNTAVLISSHILSEIELMCDKVAFIQKGKIIKVEDLKNKERICHRIAFKTSKVNIMKEFLKEKGLEFKIINEDTIYVKIKANKMEDLVSNVNSNNIPFSEVYKVKESLEEEYLKTMGED
ncbi:ABC transporter ATP-binding protein [Clostridium oceanicum]|uniref:ABC transporter ATP-binding protein n=1 Tax=Clostridium oceanicum TaxID=1543 RepID=A0ABN1JEF0_9CLOT